MHIALLGVLYIQTAWRSVQYVDFVSRLADIYYTFAFQHLWTVIPRKYFLPRSGDQSGGGAAASDPGMRRQLSGIFCIFKCHPGNLCLLASGIDFFHDREYFHASVRAHGLAIYTLET